jgi:hypothetical protein
VIYSHLEEKASIVESRVYKTATNKKGPSDGVDRSKDRMTALVTSSVQKKRLVACGTVGEWRAGGCARQPGR